MYMQAQNLGGLGDTGFDFSSLINNLVTGYSNVKQAQSAADIVKLQTQAAQAQAQAAQQAQNAALAYQLNPQYSAAYRSGTASASNLMPILLIGGAALLVYMMVK